MMTEARANFRIRSFVRRGGRKTLGQIRAHEDTWPLYGLDVATHGMLDYPQIFGREAPTILEIGFGTGQTLVALAAQRPDLNIIGVETHKPGIGALLLGLQLDASTNVRVYDADVVDVINKCIPDASLDSVQIFFPDPWQKRRHHARRLVQSAFISNLFTKLKAGGTIHLATDWDDYAIHMMKVMSAEKRLINLAGEEKFATRSCFRPILSKFERRAIRDGRSVWELQFQKP